MKHIQTYILLAGLLLGSHASAQTTLYKTYVGRTGIKASCIENYPIGNGLKVTVTMLEANDSASFLHLKKSLKALPYSGTKSEKTNDSVDYYPLKKSINKPLRDYVHELDSTPEFSHVSTLEGSSLKKEEKTTNDSIALSFAFAFDINYDVVLDELKTNMKYFYDSYVETPGRARYNTVRLSLKQKRTDRL